MAPRRPRNPTSTDGADKVPREIPWEVEVKLRLPADARAALERHPALCSPRADAPETRAEVTTYFDTAAGRLAQSGASLRVRRGEGGRLMQTLKLAPVAEGAAARRGEWEWPVGAETPDLALLAGIPQADAIGALDGALGPICTTEISRTARRIATEGGAVIEAAIDQGRIRAGDREMAVSELELELKSGPPGALYRLALELVEAAPLAIEPASKAERGGLLAGGPARSGVKPEPIALRADMPTAEAFRRVMGAAIGHMRVNLDPAGRGDAEGVHQVRVAARRLRAAIALFKPLLAPEPAGYFNTTLRGAGRVFGAARDWDVFVTETLPAAIEAEADAATVCCLRRLAEAAAPARDAAHADVADEVKAPRFAKLLLGLSAWAEGDPAGFGTAPLDRPIADTAPALLRRLMRRAAKRAKNIRAKDISRASAPELHGLRKRLKTLRYGIEFVDGLYKAKAVKAMLRPCRDLQALLGEFNDAAATTHLAGRIASSSDADLARALEALSAWAQRRAGTARGRVPKAWHALRDADPFW